MRRDLYFSKTLFEGLIFGGAYVWREICVSKSIGLALQLEQNLLFLLCFPLYLRAISKYKPPRGLYLEGQFNRGSFAFRVWEGFIHGGAYFRNFTVSTMYFSACSTILFKNVEQVMFKQLSRKLSLCYKVLIFQTGVQES